MNVFDINQQVANAFVRAEQTKGWFLANAKLLLVCLSGLFMFAGVMLLWLNRDYSLTHILASTPIGVIVGLLAVCIEGGTIFSSALLNKANITIHQELQLLEKVKARFTADEISKKESIIKRKRNIPMAMLLVCCLFSISGAELFWSTILESTPMFFHIIGYILGVGVSSLLIMFELNGAMVEQVIEETISHSALTKIALNESARSTIYNKFFKARRDFLDTPEVAKVLVNASQQSLYGTLASIIGENGMSVSGEQLEMLVVREKEVKDVAEKFLASGGNIPLESDTEPLKLVAPKSSKRMTPNKRKVHDAIAKYGKSRLESDPDKYATSIGVATSTFKRILSEA